MKTFLIPVSWEVSGFIEIEAETLEEAIEIFDNDSDLYELPSENDYIDGSFERQDYETIECYNNGDGILKS